MGLWAWGRPVPKKHATVANLQENSIYKQLSYCAVGDDELDDKLDDAQKLALLDLPDDLLVKIVGALPWPDMCAVARTCQRIGDLSFPARSGIRRCSLLCAWPGGRQTPLPAILQSMPQLSCLRLQGVPACIAEGSAALDDLKAARQYAISHPDRPLWLAFCMLRLSRDCTPADVQPAWGAMQCQSQSSWQHLVERQVGPYKDTAATVSDALVWALANVQLAKLGSPDLSALASLTTLQDLNLASYLIRKDGVCALAQLPQLHTLRLGVRLQDPDMAALAALTGKASLMSLDLSTGGQNPYRMLATSTQLKHLTVRCGGHLTNEHIDALAALTELQTLRLPHSPFISSAAALRLLRPRRPSLQRLELRKACLDADGMAALGDLTALRHLDISWSRLHWEGSRLLQRLTLLEKLALRDTSIDEATVNDIALLPALRHLDLGNNKLSATSAAALRPLAPHLQSLNVQGNTTLGEGACAFSQLTALTALSLARTGAGEESLQALAALPHLQHLDVAWNQLTTRGACAVLEMTSLLRLGVSIDQKRDFVAQLARHPSLLRLDVWQKFKLPNGGLAVEAVTLDVGVGCKPLADQISGIKFVWAGAEPPGPQRRWLKLAGKRGVCLLLVGVGMGVSLLRGRRQASKEQASNKQQLFALYYRRRQGPGVEGSDMEFSCHLNHELIKQFLHRRLVGRRRLEQIAWLPSSEFRMPGAIH